MAATISLSNLSRYKDTPIFDDVDAVRFGAFEPPPEFIDPTENVRRHTVTQDEIGFLDDLAVRFYGEGYEELWWSIALANAMIDPEREMFAGQTLLIPPREKSVQFISRAGEG